MNKLDQAREQVFYAEIAASSPPRCSAHSREREQLIRVLGLWGTQTRLQTAKSTPPLPARMRALPKSKSRRCDAALISR